MLFLFKGDRGIVRNCRKNISIFRTSEEPEAKATPQERPHVMQAIGGRIDFCHRCYIL